MSKQAVEMVKDRIEESTDGEVDFEEMVEELSEALDVKDKTAASYIYEARDLTHEWSADGTEHIVKEATAGGTSSRTGSVLQADPEGPGAFKMEPGEPTGHKFEYLSKLRSVDHPLIPDKASYFRRRLEGHKSDIQVFTYDMARDTPGGVQHVLLTGLPGVGKNQAFKHIAAETNRPMIRIPVGGGIRYEDLVGHYTPTPEGGLEWTDGLLTTAVRYGYMVILDEVDMMTGDVSSPLHQITEDQDSQELVIRQTGEVVEPHPEFRVVATRNPNFAGSAEMNQAFLDRFVEHEVSFLKKDAEVNVLTGAIDGLEEEDIEPVVDYANELRGRYPQELDLIVTTRKLKRIGAYIAGDLFDTKSAVRKVLLPAADPDTDRGPLEDEIDMRF